MGVIMLRFFLLLGLSVMLSTAPAIAASAEQDSLQQQAAAWQQRLESATMINKQVSNAWQIVEQHWQQLQAAAPEQRSGQAEKLAAALQDLEQAWTMRPLDFIAVDLATRNQA